MVQLTYMLILITTYITQKDINARAQLNRTHILITAYITQKVGQLSNNISKKLVLLRWICGITRKKIEKKIFLFVNN